MHKNFDEIEDLEKRKLSKMIYITFLIILLIAIFNFINQIIMVAVLKSGGVNIFYSFLYILIFVPF